MSLEPGHKLAHYEILEPIGKGGMGEVYRARDTKLGREVAIKILPEEFARDKERLDRFEREARLLAQLNHSNIATLYGLEEHDGQKFLAMELVEGDTLAETIANGAIPIGEAIPLFIQIAEGVEAAHEKNIIHRDLKPANIKIGPDGKPKILDFGLAKAFVGEDRSDVDASQSPTLTKGTALGTIMGTASYMSPEQARGKKVDRRTDIWAFGCCLYEALAGTRAFDGETVSDIIGAVMRAEPEWDALPPSARTLLKRCLKKEARSRLHHIADLRIELEDLQAEPGVEHASPAHAGMRKVLLVATVAVAVAVGIAVGRSWNRPMERSNTGSLQRFALDVPLEALPTANNFPIIAVSKDGTRIAYVVTEQERVLHVRELESLDSRRLTGTEGAMNPFFSPDGNWIGFFNGSELKKVSFEGGVPVALGSWSEFPRGASWGPDDEILLGSTRGLQKVSASDGALASVTSLRDGEAAHVWPEFLPNGETALFVVAGRDTSQDHAIELLSLETGERKEVARGYSMPRYLPGGYLVYLSWDGTLMAARFDGEDASASVRVQPGLVAVNQYLGSADVAISDTGTLLYWKRGEVQNFLVERSGALELLYTGIDPVLQFPRFSPDGRRIVGATHQDSWDLWVFDLERKTPTRLTYDGGVSHPVWSPDGNSVVFQWERGGRSGLYEKDLGSVGEATLVLETTTRMHATSWSPDGSTLAVRAADMTMKVQLLRLDAGEPPQSISSSSFNEFGAVFSPDGRWLAYVSDEAGRNDVYLVTYPALDRKQRISSQGGTQPVWSRDGREVFYRERFDRLMAVRVMSSGSELQLSAPELVLETAIEGFDRVDRTYDVTPDGSGFVIVKPTSLPQLIVVLNWFQELERLVPANN